MNARLTQAIITAIVSNGIIFIGYFFYHWSLFMIVLSYGLETLFSTVTSIEKARRSQIPWKNPSLKAEQELYGQPVVLDSPEKLHHKETNRLYLHLLVVPLFLVIIFASYEGERSVDLMGLLIIL